MNYKGCFRKKKIHNYNPPEVEQLLSHKKFANMPVEEILDFYSKFRNISKGQPYLDQKLFIDMLNSFNIFPNKKVAERMFMVTDSKKSSEIDFIEFMRYIFLLLDGTKEEKAYYIYRMIAIEEKDYFTFSDLLDFYKLVDQRENIDSSFVSYFETRNELEFEEMAKTVFEILQKEYDEVITFSEFKMAVMEEPELIDLFNFLNTNIDLNTKGFRMKKKFVKMLKSLNILKQELLILEEIVLGEVKPELNASMFSIAKFSQANNSIRSYMKVKKRNSNGYSLIKNVMINNNLKMKNEAKDQNNILNFKKKPVKPIYDSITGESAFEPTKKKNTQRPHIFSNTDAKVTISNKELRVKIKTLFSSINFKVENLINNLHQESEFKNQNNKFRFNLRNQFSMQSNRNNKKVVFLNDPNWNIVTSMVSGIQKSVNIIKTDKYKPLNKYDFTMHNKIEIQAMYSTKFNKCKFKDYAPFVFQSIRNQSGISNDAYVKSIGVNTFQSIFFNKLYLMLSENSSGKSGSFFFHTSDGKYMIKTIKQSEFDTLLSTLHKYHTHILENPKTLITRYYGLHKIKCYNKQKLIYDINIVVMNNIFRIRDAEMIDSKYDLKGSYYKRLTKEPQVERGDAKKDLNFINENQRLFLPEITRELLLDQVFKDANFLAKQGIIDYSLLVGIMPKSQFESYMENRNLISNTETHHKEGELVSYDGNNTYFIGIIDTLTPFNIKKKGEYLIKRPFQGKGISCVPPKQYKNRFIDFMEFCFEGVRDNPPVF